MKLQYYGKFPMRILFLPYVLALILLPMLAIAENSIDPDPNGVLRKPIPDRLVVLTFDDAPASHYTVVAPILQEMGLGGTIYVCDFDSFRTRKDWYLTYRQMNAMHASGLEIGNHTLGHASGYGPVVAMEDQVLAHGGPRMTTLCWPIYAVNWNDCPKLSEHGYTFGRGGHERTYRPTVDNPFDVPSFSIHDGVPIENFIKAAQQACQGRVVVFCFHGVPDLEHPPVSLEPATFRAMMQYLKDNHYQCLAMRDLAQYIDPAKAAKLPQTSDSITLKVPGPSLKDEKPFVPPWSANIHEVSFPGLPPVRISGTSIRLTVPYATDITKLAPNIKVSAEATLTPPSGMVLDFSKPQTFTVHGKNGATKIYTVTVNKTAISQAKEVTAFEMPGALSVAMAGNRVAVRMPMATDVRALAPTFSVSPLATAVPAAGVLQDFTKPQSYTITAQDGSTQVVSVTVLKGDKSNAFTWGKSAGGDWSDEAAWSDKLTNGGAADYLLHFNQGGACTATNDLAEGFQLNQLVLGDKSGGLIVSGHGLTFTKELTAALLPVIQAGKCGRVDFKVPMNLQADLTVRTAADKDPNCFLSFHEVISGPHALILQSAGDANVAEINFHDVHFGILQLNNGNTYTGGTVINGGKINVRKPDGLGTGTVVINHFGTLSTETPTANALVINQGTLFHCSASGPVRLNGIANFISDVTIAGSMSGPGGFTMLGRNGTYLSMVPGGTVTLESMNNYTGPTTVFPGTLIVKQAAGLYNEEVTKWTPGNITIHKAATLRLNVGGSGEFTGEQVGSLLGNLTRAVNENGLMGGSVLSLDTTNAKEIVKIAAPINDSKGPGGGAFLFKKTGVGGVQLAASNTYTGQTVVENGTLSVSSLNNYTKEHRQPSSSLGAPVDIESGEIVFGQDGKDSECALIYTGLGETTDRVLNLAGKKAMLTLDQAGTGPLKFASDLLISGYGASKTINLKGEGTGSGELAGKLTDPHDQTGKATTALTKSGTGQWTLSGTNSYTGPTTITQGTLASNSDQSLGRKPAISIASGGRLELNFKGQVSVRQLVLDGKAQPPGEYAAGNTNGFLTGSGSLRVE